MAGPPQLGAQPVELSAYDSRWPEIYAAERDAILMRTHGHVLALEHVGSTAVPQQSAKPIIDMMGAVASLRDIGPLVESLHALGYRVLSTGMRDRVFLRKGTAPEQQVFHLHLVESSTWEERHERILRDHLRAHPADVQAYGTLKVQLAVTHARDSLTYTKAKTAFIQNLMDRARAERGLAPVDVWED